jgi:HK97 family phage major capsid protein
MDDRLKALYEERCELDLASRKILDAPAGEDDGLTAEQQQEWDRMDARIAAITVDVDRREKQDKRETELSESRGRLATPTDPEAAGSSDDSGEFVLDCGRQNREVSLAAGTPEHVRAGTDYAKQFDSYLRGSGIHAGLQVGKDPSGGYLTTAQFAAQLIRLLDDEVAMRQLATVLPPLSSATSLGVPSLDTNPDDATWTPEVTASDLSEDTSLAFGKRELMPHGLAKLIKVSNKLMRTAVISPEAIVRDRMAYKFGITEEKAYLEGDGAQQPLGVFVASADGISTSRDVTMAAVDEFTGDEVINTLYNLKPGYMARSTWLVHRDWVKMARKLKDGVGNYLWQPGLATDRPATILDRPYVMCENAPNTFTTGLYIGIIGDFKEGYWIVDSLQLEVQRLVELFALTNQIGFVGRKETDGMPVKEEAFSRMILA